MKFREDGTFHILHITDIQEIPEVAEDTLTLMRRALDAAKPDLVVFTGDQLKGYSKKFRKKPGQVEKTINRIMEPVVSRGIPFAVTFGNHDEQSGMTNDEQMEIYRNIPGCVDWLNSRRRGLLPSESGILKKRRPLWRFISWIPGETLPGADTRR